MQMFYIIIFIITGTEIIRKLRAAYIMNFFIRY